MLGRIPSEGLSASVSCYEARSGSGRTRTGLETYFSHCKIFLERVITTVHIIFDMAEINFSQSLR